MSADPAYTPGTPEWIARREAARAAAAAAGDDGGGGGFVVSFVAATQAAAAGTNHPQLGAPWKLMSTPDRVALDLAVPTLARMTAVAEVRGASAGTRSAALSIDAIPPSNGWTMAYNAAIEDLTNWRVMHPDAVMASGDGMYGLKLRTGQNPRDGGPTLGLVLGVGAHRIEWAFTGPVEARNRLLAVELIALA